MKYKDIINKLMLLLLFFVGVTSCSDETTEQVESGYGYVQFHVASVGTRASQELDYLSDAKKIEVTLLQNDNRITQTLNLTSVEGMGDMGLTSEKLQLLDGSYKLQSYTLYGISETVGNDLEPIMQIDLDELTPFEVASSSITKVNVDVKSIVRGSVSFLLTKDLTAFDDQTPTSGKSLSRAVEPEVTQNPNAFNYNNIESVEIYYKKKGTQQQPFSRLFDVHRDYETGLFRTDTISIEAKEYEITHIRMFASDERMLLLAQDMKDCFVNVVPNEIQSPEVTIKYSKDNLAINDYIALYNIWKNMNGKEWSYYGENFPIGANWRFENRPVDEWGNQPCVTLNNAGRVVQLDLGAFNPKGVVPEALGNLSELEVLYLGHHNEEGDPTYITDEKNGFALDMWKLNHNPNYNFERDYMDVFRARRALTHPSTVRTDLYTPKKGDVDVMKYATPVTYGNNPGKQTNRIEKLPENIGNLTKLRALFIANGLVEELPASFKNLSSLKELEIYNCKRMKKIPVEQLKNLNLIVLNFSVNPHMFAGEDAAEGSYLNPLFDNEQNNICKSLQLMYLIGNRICKFPTNIKNITDLRMLEMTKNRLTELPDLERKFRPVEAIFADNSIKVMNDNFCATEDIETFSVTNNVLTVFPNMYKDKINGDEESTIPPAKVLDFSYNKIHSFKGGDEGFNGVKTETLNLTSNKFNNDVNKDSKSGKYCFPKALAKSGSIVLNLQLASCGLDSIPAEALLIEKDGKPTISQVVALDLRGNRLRYMSYEFHLENFPYFTGVDLSNNAFSVFPVNIFNVQAMSKVLLSGQYEIKGTGSNPVTVPCLKVFPPNIPKAFGLRVLDLSGNDIRKIRETDFPDQLAEFSVVGNPNLEMEIPSHVCTFIQMGRMYLYYDRSQMITGCPILKTDN